MYYPPRFLFRRYELIRNIEPSKSFLEIGPGSMNLTRDLLELFSNGVLVDFNEEVMEYFEKLPPEHQARLKIVISDLENAELDTQFDCVVACEVLEHLEDDLHFMETVYDLLRDGGRVHISFPARMKFGSIHDDTVGHVRRYERDDLQRLFERSGFHDTRIISYGYPFINILRILRIALAHHQAGRLSELSSEEKTKRSGTSQYKLMSGLLGIFFNRFTVLPFALAASMFNNLDRSDGYIVTASK